VDLGLFPIRREGFLCSDLEGALKGGDGVTSSFHSFLPAQPLSEAFVSNPEVVLGRRPGLREGVFCSDLESALEGGDGGA
jgi:hypothetical protein